MNLYYVMFNAEVVLGWRYSTSALQSGLNYFHFIQIKDV